MVHLVWVTKYRYPVLRGDIQKRCRELIIQICDAEDVQILKGVVSKDHIHMHVEYPSKLSISEWHLIKVKLSFMSMFSDVLTCFLTRFVQARIRLGPALDGAWLNPAGSFSYA